MSLQWTAVATFLYMEVFFVLLLCIPFISPKRSESTSYMFLAVGGVVLVIMVEPRYQHMGWFYLGLSCKSLIETEQLCGDASERFQP